MPWYLEDGFTFRFEVVGWGFEALSCLLCVIAFILYWRRRKLFPIDGRSRFLLVALFALFFQNLFHVCFVVPWMPCGVQAEVFFWTSQLAVLSYAIGFWNLFFRLQIARHLPDNHMEVSETGFSRASTPIANWYLKNRRMIRKQFLTKLYVVYFVICFVVSTCMFFEVSFEPFSIILSYKLTSNFPCLASATPLHRASWILLVFWFLLFLFAATKLRRMVADSYAMLTEMKWTFLFDMVLVTIMIILAWAPIPKGPQWIAGAYIVWGLLLLNHTIHGLIFPWRLTFVSQARTQQASNEVDNLLLPQQALSEILDSPSGFDSFLAFLKKEFSAENLLFWMAVKDYQNDNERTIQDAYYIAQQYIFTDSLWEVNLSFELRTQITRTILAAVALCAPVHLRPSVPAVRSAIRVPKTALSSSSSSSSSASMSRSMFHSSNMPANLAPYSFSSGPVNIPMSESITESSNLHGGSPPNCYSASSFPGSSSIFPTTGFPSSASSASSSPSSAAAADFSSRPSEALDELLTLAQTHVYQLMSRDSFRRFLARNTPRTQPQARTLNMNTYASLQ